MLIQDIIPTRGSWERNYAHLEYMRIGVKRTLAKIIDVVDQSEEIEAEIAWGKNTITGEWCASAYFDYE